MVRKIRRRRFGNYAPRCEKICGGKGRGLALSLRPVARALLEDEQLY
jgi:hypothetical protein